jgi:pilus assembly protein Flp/PilA
MGELPLEGLKAMPRFAKLIHDEKGATAVEYSLICALIVIAMIAGLSAFASSTITMWGNVSTAVVSHSG